MTLQQLEVRLYIRRITEDHIIGRRRDAHIGVRCDLIHVTVKPLCKGFGVLLIPSTVSNLILSLLYQALA